MKYRKGFKYQLYESFEIRLRFKPHADILTEYIQFHTDGMLYIKEGYAWDGPSGPTIDTEDSMTPSLVHDAGYQLLRAGLLPQSYKNLFDMELEYLCEERGMNCFRADYWYEGVHLFADGAAKIQQDEIIEVP